MATTTSDGPPTASRSARACAHQWRRPATSPACSVHEARDQDLENLRMLRRLIELDRDSTAADTSSARTPAAQRQPGRPAASGRRPLHRDNRRDTDASLMQHLPFVMKRDRLESIETIGGIRRWFRLTGRVRMQPAPAPDQFPLPRSHRIAIPRIGYPLGRPKGVRLVGR